MTSEIVCEMIPSLLKFMKKNKTPKFNGQKIAQSNFNSGKIELFSGAIKNENCFMIKIENGKTGNVTKLGLSRNAFHNLIALGVSAIPIAETVNPPPCECDPIYQGNGVSVCWKCGKQTKYKVK